MAEAAGSGPVIDVEALAAPIPGDNPCGPNLRQDESHNAPFNLLRQIRGQARTAEREAAKAALGSDQPIDIMRDPTVQQEWAALKDLAVKTLQEQSKDIEIVAWLIEALVRQEDVQFAGLRDGFNLAAELIERYWDNLNYDTEDTDAGAKGAPFAGLTGSGGAIKGPFKMIPLTPKGDDNVDYGLGACEQLQRDGNFGQAEALARDKGGVRFYRPLMADIKAARAAYERFTTLIDDKLGRDAPGSSETMELFATAEQMVQLLGGQYLVEDEAAGSAAAADGAPGGAAGGAAIARPGTFATREQALEMLNAVAKFFREREPHSPISYALESMIERARMPLFDLLADLLPDEDARRRVLQNAGIRPPRRSD